MKSRIPKKKIIIVSGIVLILLVEIVLQITNIPYMPAKPNPFIGLESSFSLFFETKDSKGERIYQTRADRLAYFNHETFAREKPADVFRIFCFGGAATYGFPYGGSSAFPEWLQINLDLLTSQKKYEVINVGGISFGSQRIKKLAQKMVNYEPDLFVFYMGQDEFLEAGLDQELRIQEMGGPSVEFINNIKLINLAKKIVFSSQSQEYRLTGKEIFIDEDIVTYFGSTEGLITFNQKYFDKNAILEQFGKNLENIIEVSKQKDIRIIFTTVPDNILEFSPFKSQHKNNLSKKNIVEWEKLFFKGTVYQKQKKFQDALKEYQQAFDIDDLYAELSYRIAQCMIEIKQGDLAKSYFQRAKDLDRSLLRPAEKINEIIQKIGKLNEIQVLDLKPIFVNKSLYGVPDGTQFIDHNHLTIQGHQLIAASLFQFLIDNKIISTGQNLNRRLLAAAYEKNLREIPRRNLTNGIIKIAKLLDRADKIEEKKKILIRNRAKSVGNAEYNYLLGESLLHDDEFEESIFYFRKAIELDPQYSKALIELGAALEKTGQPDEALKNYQKAVAINPKDYAAKTSMGRIYYLRQEYEKSIITYEAAVKLNPDYPRVHEELGVIYYHYQNDTRFAVKELQKAIELDSNFAEAYYNLGVIYLENNNLDEVMINLKKAIQNDPYYSDAYSSLGVYYYRQKMFDPAVELLKLAILINPKSGQAHSNLAVVYYGIGKFDDALRHADLAQRNRFEIHPDFIKAIGEEAIKQ